MNRAHTQKTVGIRKSRFAGLHLGRFVPWVAAIVVAAAMVYLFLSMRQTVWSYFSDDRSIREDALTAAPRLVLFDEPSMALADFNVPSSPYHTTFAPDEASMFLAMRRESKNETGDVVAVNYDLYTSEWTGSRWLKPVPISSVNPATNNVIGGAVSRDGRYLFFSSDRPGGFGGYDIWVASWTGTNWGCVTNAGPAVNTLSDEVDPSVSPDGCHLFFSSNRQVPDSKNPGGFLATGFDTYAADLGMPEVPAATNAPAVAEEKPVPPPASKQKGKKVVAIQKPQKQKGKASLAALPTQPVQARVFMPRFDNAARIPTINSPADDRHVSVTPRGDFLFLSSNNRGGVGGSDIFQGRVVGGNPQVPSGMGREINSENDDILPSSRMEGFDLLFNSNRGLNNNKESFRLYTATTREVETRMDYSRLDRLIANLLALRWWILAFFAALLALIYMIRHFKDLTNLFHKCLMGSAIIHAILVLLLASWKISSKMVEQTEGAPKIGGEISINVNALAREKLTVEIAGSVVQIPQSQVTVIAKQASEYVPLADFTPMETSPQRTIVARSTQEAVLLENAPSAPREAAVSPGRQQPAPSVPKKDVLPELKPPEVNVVMDTKTGGTEPAVGKPMEAFEPVRNVPSKSAVKVEHSVAISPSGSAGPATPGTNRSVSATASAVGTGRSVDSGAPGLAVPNTGGTVVRLSRGEDVSAGPSPISGSGDLVSLRLASNGKDGNLRSLMPGELAVPSGFGTTVSPYLMRKSGQPSLQQVEGLGGSGTTEGAVGRALDWFTAHQEPDGRWSIEKHGGKRGHDVAATALPLLCYMGWGIKHNAPGKHQPPAAKAIAFLLSQVKPDGDVRGNGGDMYDQGIASIALAEAYALTKDESLRPVVSNVVQFIIRAQNPSTGGWRYQPGQPGDMSVLGWQLMALMSAKMAGIDVPTNVLNSADKWLTSVGGGEQGGLYGYENKNPAPGMAAEGMFCRQIMGVISDDPRMGEGAGYMQVRLPVANEVNYYYWYYGTLAMYQHRGPAWELWNDRLKTVLPPMQATTGDDAGSWPVTGHLSGHMGRVVTTALSTLSLEVYYRYLPFAFTRGRAPTPQALTPTPSADPPPAPQPKTPKTNKTTNRGKS